MKLNFKILFLLSVLINCAMIVNLQAVAEESVNNDVFYRHLAALLRMGDFANISRPFREYAAAMVNRGFDINYAPEGQARLLDLGGTVAPVTMNAGLTNFLIGLGAVPDLGAKEGERVVLVNDNWVLMRPDGTIVD